jgi:cytochrome oxidase assembly protein ShyY1
VVFNFSIDEDLERVKTERLLGFLNLEIEIFYDIKGDLEVLINRGFIKQKKEDRSNNLFNSSFVVNQKLLDMLFRNEEIQFEKLYGNGYNFVQFSGQICRLNSLRLVNHMSREDVLNEVIEQENKNENLTQIKTMKSLGLDVMDRMVMYYMIHKYNENEKAINSYTVGFDLLGASKVLSFTKKFKEKTTQMQVQGLVELSNDTTLQLTDKAKELFLNDATDTIDEESRSEVSTTHYYIKHDAIPEKKLYFNTDLQRELNILQTLLQKDNFDEYQNELKKRGNTGGVSILIYGPSGTGKSSIVDQLAKQTKRNIFQVDLSQSRSKWYGDSEKMLKNIFVEYKTLVAKQGGEAPILLFNECDALLGKRNTDIEDRHDFTEATMTNLLLEQFEKNSGIIIGITNLEQNLDPAFLRRFTMKYYIGNPDKRAVKSILKNKIDFLENREVERIANQFQLSGGQIENISTKCIINRIITKSNPTINEVMDMCEEEKIKSNKWLSA